MERHQIDLVDMKDEAVEFQGDVYRYILTVQDIFSRFMWMRPLQRKKSKAVSEELEKIYREHGPPKILQCDNGGEFKGNTRHVCKKIGIKIINSRAYHPQSQGKVERSHRTLREKIRYDILQEKGSNWVERLPSYQSIMNDDVKNELGGRSPFEIYFGRKSNYVICPNAESDDESEGDEAMKKSKIWPNLSEVQLKEFDSTRKLIEKATYNASSKCAKAMVNRALKRSPLPIYRMKEKVIVRYPFELKKNCQKKIKRIYAISGEVIARNIPLSKYKIKYNHPETKKSQEDWIYVNHITSKSNAIERKRKKFSKIDEYLKAADSEKRRKELFIVLTHDEKMESTFDRYGYTILFNPEPDGNCQFSAVLHQLKRQKLTDLSLNEIRQQVVSYMQEYELSPFNERDDFRTAFDSNRFNNYADYLTEMRRHLW